MEDIRTRFMDELKTAMKAGNQGRVAALRMITAKLKDLDIAARGEKPVAVGEEEIFAMLKGMIKSRQDSVALYRQGGRPELAEKEEAEIKVIEEFLPPQMDEQATRKAVEEAISEMGATTMKDMGKVMGVLKKKYGATLDLGQVNQLVKEKLS
ncbi:GatB/YqeY domain-containing protein [Entomobacter blattae]|uniref:GatB/YqeY domain-containing protein n=1 Tax=Entomobacter blattae TaxID=2762277 RepID=A0A7H1NNB0_9PROT|nr:GatB/YqeY domain-containing protein [Entomobacter blattae]QNT77270.1 putative protein YqeY [Entomobacter blattae]